MNQTHITVDVIELDGTILDNTSIQVAFPPEIPLLIWSLMGIEVTVIAVLIVVYVRIRKPK